LVIWQNILSLSTTGYRTIRAAGFCRNCDATSGLRRAGKREAIAWFGASAVVKQTQRQIFSRPAAAACTGLVHFQIHADAAPVSPSSSTTALLPPAGPIERWSLARSSPSVHRVLLYSGRSPANVPRWVTGLSLLAQLDPDSTTRKFSV